MTPQTAETIIQNAYVVTFDGAGRIIADGAIVINGGEIVAIGDTSDITREWTTDNRVFAGGKIAIPGLIDAHMHSAQTMMRGLITSLAQVGNLRVPTWREYYVPFEAALRAEDVELSGELAYTSMLRSGTTTFFEAGGPHPERMAAAALSTGIRGSVSLSTMDGGSRIPDSMLMTRDEAVEANVRVVESLASGPGASPRVTGGMSLRQIITCSPGLVVDIHREARKRNVKVHTHLVEGTYEIDHSLEQFGLRPVDYLIDLGVFDETLHCAHSVFLNDADIGQFASRGTSACHCAKGNYAIGHPPALEMWRRGVSIGLGTDGVGSFGTLDMFRVAMLTRIGQQLVHGTPVHNRNDVRAAEPLQMAVNGGARAMGLEKQIGSLEVGKRADIVLVATDSADAAGYSTAEAFLYDCANGSDVHTVIVDGEVVVSDREVLTADVETIARRAAERQKELTAVIA
ncbi:amidohydrolase family protein [Microbacterium sp.]|uniref:amidohydrolase family protein n=1 Tax=Microbacterium sp. TaxID=51671 RepID=UPI0026030186|nr:amidohydrolase family protein [Microbacterium sp.]